MDFQASAEAVEEMVGIEVSATFWGLGDDASLMGSLQGKLRSHHKAVPGCDLREFDELGEIAVTFAIGDHWGNEVALWPSRFVSAERLEVGTGVEITTLDGKVLVQTNRPWID